jgi:hypothetical protein
MTLIDGARELARNEYQMGCAVEHVFLAALPPNGYRNLDDETRSVTDTFTGQTLREWSIQARTKLENFQNPPPIGQDSQDLTEILTAAEAHAIKNKRERDDDRSLLLFIVMRTARIQTWIDRINPGDAKRLIDKLSEARPEGAEVFAQSGAMEIAKLKEEEAKAGRENLPDLLDEVDPSPDLRYAEFAAIDVKTFLDNLAVAEDVDNVVVAIGRDGTLINELPKVMADRMQKGNTFSGQQAALNAYTGTLYRIDLRKVIDRARQKKTFKPVTVLYEAWKQLLAPPQTQKPVLLLDHIEALRPDVQDPALENELKDMRAQITDPGQLLVFGIFHAPNHGDHTGEASLGRPDIVITQPMNKYDDKQTKALIQRFYLKHWQKEGRGFDFDSNTFDLLIALEPGAWVRRRRMVLPCLVTEIVSDAMSTALLGTAQIEATARCALDAFAELKGEAQGHAERGNFEPILNKAEKEVNQLLPSSGSGFLGGLFGAGQQGKVEPGKRIKIISAHVMAEFICHNVSEFHYPGKFPRGITEEV